MNISKLLKDQYVLVKSVAGATTRSIKSTVVEIDKALISDCLRLSKVSGKFHIPTIFNFAIVCP